MLGSTQVDPLFRPRAFLAEEMPNPLELRKSTSTVPNDSYPKGSSPTDDFSSSLWLPEDWCGLNVAVALSGGADSISLLRVLQLNKRAMGGAGRLIAFHVNHQLRGIESTADAQWCQQQCDTLGIPLEVLNCDTAQFADDSGESIESAARTQRYQLLTAAAQQAGCRYLATAHTQDDQVETVLFRILRGTGLRGLAGIPRTRVLTRSLTLIRPLLNCSRSQVIEYLSAIEQGYRTDSSNASRQFSRNRLRHDLLPMLREQYNTKMDAAVVRLAAQADDAQHLVEMQATKLLDDAQLTTKLATTKPATTKSSTLSLHWQVFAKQEPVVVREALRIAWRGAGLPEQTMTYEWWKKLSDFIQHPREGHVLNLPRDVSASIAGGLFFLSW